MCTSALGFTLRKEIKVSASRFKSELDANMDVTQAYPAGLGDPAPLTPLSILPALDSLGWAVIRFLRTHLQLKDNLDHLLSEILNLLFSIASRQESLDGAATSELHKQHREEWGLSSISEENV